MDGNRLQESRSELVVFKKVKAGLQTVARMVRAFRVLMISWFTKRVTPTEIFRFINASTARYACQRNLMVEVKKKLIPPFPIFH